MSSSSIFLCLQAPSPSKRSPNIWKDRDTVTAFFPEQIHTSTNDPQDHDDFPLNEYDDDLSDGRVHLAPINYELNIRDTTNVFLFHRSEPDFESFIDHHNDDLLPIELDPNFLSEASKLILQEDSDLMDENFGSEPDEDALFSLLTNEGSTSPPSDDNQVAFNVGVESSPTNQQMLC